MLRLLEIVGLDKVIGCHPNVDQALLEHLVFTTELIVSELVTNAIRYGGAPVGLRLIRDQRLICEVSDPSQTQPHLRRARWTDEGGRGWSWWPS